MLLQYDFNYLGFLALVLLGKMYCSTFETQGEPLVYVTWGVEQISTLSTFSETINSEVPSVVLSDKFILPALVIC